MAAAKPTILIYANCQGGAVAHALRSCPSIAEIYDVADWENFPDEGHAHEITGALRDRCEIFLHQVGEWGRTPPPVIQLPGGALTLHFPPGASNALFPLRGDWPDCVARSPWPFRLHIDFTDRIAIDLAQQITDKPTYLAEYARIDIAEEVDAWRMHEFDMMWMARNEAICDIAISDVLADKISRQRICWMPGQMTNPVLHVLVHRLINRLAADFPVPFRTARRAIARELQAVFEGDEYFGGMKVPIHPQIAEILKLEWYDKNEIYTHAEDASWTHPAFIAAIHDYVNGKPLVPGEKG